LQTLGDCLYTRGYRDFEPFLKIDMRHALEKAFFYILSGFFLNWSFVLKNLENKLLRGEFFFLEILGIKKIKNLCLFL
jgi:hypothetical protein